MTKINIRPAISTDISKMIARLLPESRISPSLVCLYHPEAEQQLINMGLAVGTGGSSLNAFQFTESGKPNLLYGIDAYPSEHCSPVGTEGDIILADLNY